MQGRRSLQRDYPLEDEGNIEELERNRAWPAPARRLTPNPGVGAVYQIQLGMLNQVEAWS